MAKQDKPGEEHRYRWWGGTTGKIITGYIVAVILFQVLYAGGVLHLAGIETHWYWLVISREQLRRAYMFLITPILLLLFPATKGAPKGKLPWYDVLLIVIALAGHGWQFFGFQALQNQYLWGTVTTWDTVAGLVLLALTCEASRRTYGPWIAFIAVIFFIYPLFGESFPSFLHTKTLGLGKTVLAVVWGYSGLYGHMVQVMAVIVVPYILFGQLLVYSGAGRFFVNLALGLLGRLRGGPALAAVGASALMGSVNMSPSANVASIGMITIPLMKDIGYKPKFAAAVESASSAAGLLLPPVMGTVAFIMADFLGITYWQVCIAAFVPAILYYLAVGLMVYLEAAKTGLKTLTRAERPSLVKTLSVNWQFLLPIAALVLLLGLAGWPAEKAALGAVVATIVVSMFRNDTRINWKKLIGSFLDTARMIAPLTMLFALAGIMIGSLETTGLGVKLSSGLIGLAGGNAFLLLVMAAVSCLILGMPLPTSGAYIVVAVLVAPALQGLGVSALAAHMFVLYYAMLGPITPPTCGECFVAAGIAGPGTSPFGTAWTAMRLAIVAIIVPFSFAYEPLLLLQGAPLPTVLALITAVIGILALGIGIQGWLFAKANWLQRVGFLAAAVMLFWPGWQTRIIGLAVGMLAASYHLMEIRWQRRRLPVLVEGEDRQ